MSVPVIPVLYAVDSVEVCPTVKCRKCGATIAKDVVICWNCGYCLDRNIVRLEKEVKKHV